MGELKLSLKKRKKKHKRKEKLIRNIIEVNCGMIPYGQQLNDFSFAVMNCSEYKHRLDLHIEEWETQKKKKKKKITNLLGT